MEPKCPSCKSLQREIDDLTEWKKQAMRVFEDLKLQEIGQTLGVKLGGNIAVVVLPALKRLRDLEDQKLT
jgi:hypothetical protein